MFLPRLTPVRPWSPLTDAEWHALLPYVLLRSPQGRRMADLRARMDAIFHVAARHAPWREAPERYGRPDTVHRHFRRLTHAGLWQRLLQALADAAPSHPLRAVEHLICRAARRAHRLLGLGFNAFVRRIGLRSALPGPPWLLPDPLLSETLARVPVSDQIPRTKAARDAAIAHLRTLRALWKIAAGRARLSPALRRSWP